MSHDLLKDRQEEKQTRFVHDAVPAAKVLRRVKIPVEVRSERPYDSDEVCVVDVRLAFPVANAVGFRAFLFLLDQRPRHECPRFTQRLDFYIDLAFQSVD